MNLLTTLVVIAIIGGGIYFAYWGIQRTLREDKRRSKRGKRTFRRR